MYGHSWILPDKPSSFHLFSRFFPWSQPSGRVSGIAHGWPYGRLEGVQNGTVQVRKLKKLPVAEGSRPFSYGFSYDFPIFLLIFLWFSIDEKVAIIWIINQVRSFLVCSILLQSKYKSSIWSIFNSIFYILQMFVVYGLY